MRQFTSREEQLLKTLTNVAEANARAYLQELHGEGIIAKIISGTRSYEEQDRLYAQGRTAPGNIVTKARGGFSNHNFGIAWDIGVFDDDGNYLTGAEHYTRAGIIAEEMGLIWGGRWKSFPDASHIECRTDPPGLTLSQMRERVKSGAGFGVQAVRSR